MATNLLPASQCCDVLVCCDDCGVDWNPMAQPRLVFAGATNIDDWYWPSTHLIPAHVGVVAAGAAVARAAAADERIGPPATLLDDTADRAEFPQNHHRRSP